MIRPVALSVIPERAFWRIVLICAGIALLALAARIEIPLPFSPVPVTGQTFAVLLIGAALGARLGAVTVAAYVILGAAGLPLFSGGATGIARVVGPTGGYLAGFIVAAAVVGWLAERGWTRTVPLTLATMLIGEAAIYLFGLVWLSRFSLPVGVLDAGLLPFVVGDLYKVALAVALLPFITRQVARRDRQSLAGNSAL